MTDSFLIINARVPHFQGLQDIWVRDGVIRALHNSKENADHPVASTVRSTDLPILDVAGDWVSLGGVDLQINGALGLAFPDLNFQNIHSLDAICQFLWSQGVDGFLPTIVTTSIENIQRSLAALSTKCTLKRNGAAPPTKSAAYSDPTSQILGVHLEGPFLNPQKRGAHPEKHLLPLSVEQIKRVLGDYGSVVKVITLAPELDPTGDAIAYLRSLDITVSLGHSQATTTQAQQAFAQGASLVTHAFNAMPSLHHREPGLLGAAISAGHNNRGTPPVQCSLIADGQHVSTIMMDILLRASRYDEGIFLVSDALAPLGLPDGRYPWDDREIEVINGTARLLDGTLSGTTLPLLVGVQNLVRWQICEVEAAIALATTAPRRAIALPSSYLHQPAHLLRWGIDADSHHLTWQRITPKF
ncbi:N-acetylglucosamine-6-phosphate deacetylase [Myxacorys almedinensis]|uniref:N-acetylglucosamine-6-phosphate deacetylase n=1 Tax=Myxacorys almedinensis A TaxID=2690445 RepID=A0A8J7Z602_9CYAN|nr:N-acetylglucosamine-6-phosphate deacetylase [Myxacorys almedinensis]NDJ16110.1 N-acetylglucosamine-6-phosphate deacetylase [Myxacorys almedinensis A]